VACALYRRWVPSLWLVFAGCPLSNLHGTPGSVERSLTLRQSQARAFFICLIWSGIVSALDYRPTVFQGKSRGSALSGFSSLRDVLSCEKLEIAGEFPLISSSALCACWPLALMTLQRLVLGGLPPRRWPPSAMTRTMEHSTTTFLRPSPPRPRSCPTPAAT
jgi:hypothetical protein